MTYRQSEMYNCAKYLKNLPRQSVSSKGNLQVVGNLQVAEVIGMTSNTFKERYRNHIKQIFHKQKIFERDGTFETRLALKAKENRFHHKMVHNKKVYFLHGRIQKM